jgi:hypothetical protein
MVTAGSAAAEAATTAAAKAASTTAAAVSGDTCLFWASFAVPWGSGAQRHRVGRPLVRFSGLGLPDTGSRPKPSPRPSLALPVALPETEKVTLTA